MKERKLMSTTHYLVHVSHGKVFPYVHTRKVDLLQDGVPVDLKPLPLLSRNKLSRELKLAREIVEEYNLLDGDYVYAVTKTLLGVRGQIHELIPV